MHVGNYAISQGTLSAGSNYTIVFSQRRHVRNHAAADHRDSGQKTKILNAPDPALTYTLTSGTLVSGDSLTAALHSLSLSLSLSLSSIVAKHRIGTYTIRQGR